MQDETEREVLEKSLDKIGNRSWWIWLIFILCSSPGVFNAAHIMSYVFLSHTPTHWCRIDELIAANWTTEQIRNVSSPNGPSESSCNKYDWDYSKFASLGYEGSLEYILQSGIKPKQVACKEHSFSEEVLHSSIVSEWDLTCERSTLRTNAQVSIALGKLIGGLLFGFLADKFGRKRSFVLACLMYILSSPVAALTYSYLVFVIARFVIGLAGSGVYESAYTILTEIAVKRRRTVFGCIFNLSYPFGMMILPVCAIMYPNWRHLQLAISLPTLILLIHCWIIPESPRWLLSQGRRSEAWQVIQNMDNTFMATNDLQKTDKSFLKEEDKVSSWYKRLILSVKKLLVLFRVTELRNRILICYFTWFVSALSYYAIALNADNFTANRYLYVMLNGLVEAPSYIMPLTLLSIFGRKSTASFLFLVSGISLISILAISPIMTSGMLCMALIGRFCISAVFSVIILHTSELFPTTNRNSAIGTSLAVSQFGTVAAPYIVDILGTYGWYIPSTICGCLAIFSCILSLLLPETRDRPMMETVNDLKQDHHVSIRNCCSFS